MIDNTDGYIPAPDAIVHECGPRAAVVWGVVWCYCQTGEGVCRASPAAIGRHVRLGRVSVRRQLRTLVDAGYLADLSPGAQRRAHVYADTGRVPLDLRSALPLRPFAPERPRRTKTAGRVRNPAPVESQQDTSAVPPRPADDDAYDDQLYEQDDGPDEALLVELLAEHFCRLAGIGRPRPRDENQLREARALWAEPLRRIAASCGSAAVGRRVITAAVAVLRAKGCIVSAPISIVSTAEALATRQRARHGTADR